MAFVFVFQDTFFYSLVYDPSVKTLLADKGEIRVGPKYQADIPDMLPEGECALGSSPGKLVFYNWRVFGTFMEDKL